MMNTQYLTFILRLRLDNRVAQQSASAIVSGSVQQAGRQDIHYFDSLEQLLEALRQQTGSLSSKEMNDGKSE